MIASRPSPVNHPPLRIYPRPLPQVYPWKTSQDKRMTIAVGFKCRDGVVLAADSQYTEGFARLYGPKLFQIPSNGHYALSIAGAGNVPIMKGVVEDLEDAVAAVGKRKVNFKELKTVIEDVLRAFYPKHIDSAPAGVREDLWFGLLIGVWVANEGTRLYETSRTKATVVPRHRCLGCGSYLTEYMVDLLLPRAGNPTVEVAQPLAAYIVGMAKKYVEYCGGQTRGRILMEDGADVRVRHDEIADAEEFYTQLFKTVGGFQDLLNAFIGSVDVDTAGFAKLLKDHLLSFREKQKGYQDWRAGHRNSSRKGT